MSDWYQRTGEDVLRQLDVAASSGLSEAEAARRLAESGPNELKEASRRCPWRLLWEQLTSTMVVLLIIAALVSLALGDIKDVMAILAIVLLNAALGFSQEYRAEQAMAALQRLAVPAAPVRRDGRVTEIPARELVPGDIVLLEAGQRVPADCRLLHSVNLRVREAALTGESEPIEKSSDTLTGTDVPLGDRLNIAYMGTAVIYGRAEAVVTDTGMATALGRIAAMIEAAGREPTPLQRRLDRLGRTLAAIAMGLVGVIFLIGLLRGEPAKQMFLTAVSLAVAAIPEGLPAVVTIALALGAQRMLRRRALIRKLPAVETLGSVTVICSDKTGTLTQDRMTVTVLDVAGHRIDLTEHLRRGAPVVESAGEPPFGLGSPPALSLLLAGGALCNDARLQPERMDSAALSAVGDPTEGALVVAAARMGLEKATLEQIFPRLAEIPFASERKRMTTIHALPAPTSVSPGVLEPFLQWILSDEEFRAVAFTKGAVDTLLDRTQAVWVEDCAEPLDDRWRGQILAAHDDLAQNGMRVLGVAFRPLRASPPESCDERLEQDLIFIGMVGIIDPPRPEVREAVRSCKAAGIRPVLITGDHPLTARYVARELDLVADGQILTGQDLAHLSSQELRGLVDQVSIYARVAPEHKLSIVEALQRRGEIVAMTGDGVNDAPALQKADIGVAMGITGTEVAKEAADMVLLDDNFATIVAAVEEGRAIYDNTRKFIRYLLSANCGELWVMLLGPLCGMPLPLLPLQILWVNLATDGLPAVALAVEPSERGAMRRAPNPPAESAFGRDMARHVLWVGLLMGLVSLGVGYAYWRAGRATWQTMLFTTLTLSQLGQVLAVRSERDSLLRIGLLTNRPLLGAVVLTFVLQVAILYLPLMQEVLQISPLPMKDLLVSLVVSTVVFGVLEFQKWLLRRRHAGAGAPRDTAPSVASHR